MLEQGVAMAKAKTTTKQRETKATLPKALVRRAAALSAHKRARLVAEAKELIALVRRRKDDIADAFYDIGEALAKLKSREMIVALGLRSFAEVCETKLSMSASFAEQLIDVARSMSRQEAIAMGQSKAIALVGIAQATPQGDTPGEIFRAGRIDLPGRASVDVRKASVREITRAAKRLRDAHDKAHPRRGRTTTPEERAYGAKIQKALHAAGLDGATVEVLATKPGKASELRIAHVAIDGVAALARALAKVADEDRARVRSSRGR
jgi:hypothetical protein